MAAEYEEGGRKEKEEPTGIELSRLQYRGIRLMVHRIMVQSAYTACTAVSMCVTLQRAAREVSGKCYQSIANMKLECSFRCWPLEQEGGEA